MGCDKYREDDVKVNRLIKHIHDILACINISALLEMIALDSSVKVSHTPVVDIASGAMSRIARSN